MDCCVSDGLLGWCGGRRVVLPDSVSIQPSTEPCKTSSFLQQESRVNIAFGHEVAVLEDVVASRCCIIISMWQDENIMEPSMLQDRNMPSHISH